MNEQEQLQQQLKAYGARLAMLLEVADIPDEEKDSWLALTEEMTLEQFDKLVNYLQKKVPQNIQDELRDFLAEVAKAESAHRSRVNQASDQAMDELDALERDLGL